jgi:acetyl esterase
VRTRETLKLDWLNGDVGELRAAYERACRVADTDHGAWVDIPAPARQLRALVHEPTRLAAGDCAIIYFHGGGWIVGSPATHADVSGALCERTGLRVISIDYRLAPEHKAPAPIEDGLLALEFFFARERGRDRLNCAILCGDSAGGAIAMAVERFSTAPIRKKIIGVCSLYGGFGLIGSKSMRLYGSRERGTDSACVERYWTLANDMKHESPYSILALRSDSPVPAYLLICGKDPLRDDSLSMAHGLRAAGREVAIDFVKSGTHGFLHEGQRPDLANEAIKRVARWIERKRMTWRA